GRNIYSYRAVALAAFARQAEIKRLFDVLVLPTIADDLALGHLPQQVSSPTSRMLFLPGDPETRAHDSTFVTSALPDANAAQGGASQAAVVVHVLEVRLRLPRLVVEAKPQVFVEAVRLNHLAGIHLPLGVPQRLKLPERLHQFRTEHPGKQFRARLPVPMFTGQGTAITDHQVCRLFHEPAELADAFLAFHVIAHPAMNAPMSEVAVQHAAVAVAVHQLAQISKIAAPFLGGDCRAFPSLPPQGLAWSVRDRAQARLADFPHSFDLVLVGEKAHLGWTRLAPQRIHQCSRLGFGLTRAVRAELGKQPSTTGWKQCQPFGVDPFSPRVLDKQVIHTLEADRPVSHDLRHAVGALVDVRIGNRQQHALLRTFDQSARRFEDGNAGTFASHQDARNIESVFWEQVIQVVPRDTARNIRITASHQLSIFLANRLQTRVDLSPAPTRSNDLLQFGVAGFPYPHPFAVISHDFQRFDVLVGLARHHGMHTAGVVPDHSTQGAAVMGRRIGPKSELVSFRGRA